MNKIIELQDEIKLKAGLGSPEATGWYACQCPVCKNTRKTGGFMFEDDKVIYQCFRASCDSNCGLTQGEYVSKKFRTLMDILGINVPIELLTAKKKTKLLETVEDDRFEKHRYKQIEPPFKFTKLEKSNKKLANTWKDYFESRFVDHSSFLLIEEGKYIGNVAIPMYFFDRVIGYTIATPDGYIKEYKGNTDLLYLPNRMVPDTPIVVEGVIDALSIPYGVGIGSYSLSKKQAWFLQGKDVIFVPDRSGNEFIKQFSVYDWKISLPDWDVKDVNEAVCKYGVIETMKRIKEGTIDSKGEAMVRYKIWKED